MNNFKIYFINNAFLNDTTSILYPLISRVWSSSKVIIKSLVLFVSIFAKRTNPSVSLIYEADYLILIEAWIAILSSGK